MILPEALLRHNIIHCHAFQGPSCLYLWLNLRRWFSRTMTILYPGSVRVFSRWYLNIKSLVCDSLPGRKRGDELPLLGPADGGWWDTVDLAWQNGILTLNHRHSHWLRCTSRAINFGSRTNWENIHGQANAERSIQSVCDNFRLKA